MSKEKAISPWLYFTSGAAVGALFGVVLGFSLEPPFWAAALITVGAAVIYGLIAVATDFTPLDFLMP